jgi:hypothetical protein
MDTAFDANTRDLLIRLHPDGSDAQLGSLADLLTPFGGLGEVEGTITAAAKSHPSGRATSSTIAPWPSPVQEVRS